MNSPEDLLLGEDGIPILRDVVRPERTSRDPVRSSAPLPAVSLDTRARKLLDSPDLRKAIDGFAAELSLSIYQNIDRTMKPVIEQAIRRALDEAGSSSYDEIRQRLESIIPDILARILEETDPDC